MNVEQRLIQAFEASARVEPTPDLFSRVVHSIEEDRRHRRRVIRTTAVSAATFVVLVVAGAMSIDGDGALLRVHRPTLEILEAIALATMLVLLGPAIRRFGRNYAADLWPPGAETPRLLLPLLDVAYYLVGAGYILLTTEFRFGASGGLLAEQLGDASVRIGGLLLALGALHATTLFVLPTIAFVDNATRAGKPLPRWIVLLLVVLAFGVAFVLQMAIGVGMSG